jgi:hypothetical protein
MSGHGFHWKTMASVTPRARMPKTPRPVSIRLLALRVATVITLALGRDR